MWDNRKKKKNDKQPDYRCKNENCHWTWIWDKDTEKGHWQESEYITSLWENQLKQINDSQPQKTDQQAITRASELKADTILITASLKNAIEYSQGKDVKPEAILITADVFYNWMCNKTKGNGHAKPTNLHDTINKEQQDKILLALRDREFKEVSFQVLSYIKSVDQLTHIEGEKIYNKLVELNKIADNKND